MMWREIHDEIQESEESTYRSLRGVLGELYSVKFLAKLGG